VWCFEKYDETLEENHLDFNRHRVYSGGGFLRFSDLGNLQFLGRLVERDKLRLLETL